MMETTSLFHTASKRGISSGINVCLLLEDAFSTSTKSKIHLLQQKVGIFYIAIYAQNNKLSDMILPYDEIMNKTKRLLLYTFPGPGDKELIPKKIGKSIIFSLVVVKKKGGVNRKTLVVSSVLCQMLKGCMYVSYGATHHGKFSQSFDWHGDNLPWCR